MNATIRSAVDADRKFVIETTARVRQPMCMEWYHWEPYGIAWAERVGYGEYGAGGSGGAWVVEADGVLLGYVLVAKAWLDDVNNVECIFVKEKFRGLGFGQLLLDAAGVVDVVRCRAPTASWQAWCRRRGIKWEAVD